MSLRYYMDHHVHAAITTGLRRRGVACLTAQEDGTADWPDERLLQRATELNRVLFSQDDDLLHVAAGWLAAGRPFSGLVYGEQLRLTIGQAIADLELIAKAVDESEIRSRFEYLPL